ncbi:hypothetical protein OJAV_G00026790 [Oryzias javanicus]|uniref:Uncharacterized protein n=1 Tax=Oryzias javanicus TaxID=123683 RepID=A0A3S2PG37_ORYJA|nr:hypothetical protein OJAV_G00026790 [Oryzias javanicus]
MGTLKCLKNQSDAALDLLYPALFRRTLEQKILQTHEGGCFCLGCSCPHSSTQGGWRGMGRIINQAATARPPPTHNPVSNGECYESKVFTH